MGFTTIKLNSWKDVDSQKHSTQEQKLDLHLGLSVITGALSGPSEKESVEEQCESLGDACWWLDCNCSGLQLQWIARRRSRGGEECLPSTCSIAVEPSALGHFHC